MVFHWFSTKTREIVGAWGKPSRRGDARDLRGDGDRTGAGHTAADWDVGVGVSHLNGRVYRSGHGDYGSLPRSFLCGAPGKNVDFALKCLDFVLNVLDLVLKMFAFVLKMLDFAGGGQPGSDFVLM